MCLGNLLSIILPYKENSFPCYAIFLHSIIHMYLGKRILKMSVPNMDSKYIWFIQLEDSSI